MKFNCEEYNELSMESLSVIKGGDYWKDLLYIQIESGLPIGWNWYLKK